MRKIDLTLNFVDVPTSKKALNNDYNYKIIKKYIEEKNISDGLYITYKNYIKMFEKYKYANYFGNIKGLNEYKDLTQMFQVGLNMFPPLEYFFVLCDNYDWLYRSVSQMSLEKSIEFFHKIIQLREDYYVNDLNLKDEIECVKAYSILSDFEQNLFRISIRNSNNTTPNICWLFFHHSHDEYTLILNTLINRYNEYGATVHLLETPLIMTLNKILQRDNGGTKTKVQEVLHWIMEKEPNKEFTTKEIKNALGMDNRAFDKVKEKGLNELFKLIKVEGRNAYIINDNVAKMLNMLK